MVIGHEIIHGFDDQGRKFDSQGNLRDWWTDADAKSYETRGKCISDQYSQEIPEAGVKQNGELTLGEDTADNGGIRLAFMALEDKLKIAGKSVDAKGEDGWTPRQRFFLSFANSWCTQYRPELMRTVVLTNPHSIPKYRVNNTVANSPDSSQAFGCKKGSPMARENACRAGSAGDPPGHQQSKQRPKDGRIFEYIRRRHPERLACLGPRNAGKAK